MQFMLIIVEYNLGIERSLAVKTIGIGERLKNSRIKSGYSTRDIEKELGISNGYLSLLENGKRMPSLSTLDQLCQFYKVPISYILGEDVFQGLDEREKEILLDLLKSEERANLLWETRNLTPEEIQKILEVVKLVHSK